MIEGQLRYAMQPFINKLAEPFSLLQPTTLTLAGLLNGFLCFLCVSNNYTVGAQLFLLLAGLCDVLDGTIARMHNKSSATGAYVDIISDRIVEMLFIIGLYVRQPENAFAYIFFLAALLLHFSTFISAGALIKNEGQKSLHHEYSYIERAEAFIVFSGILFLPQWCFILLCGLSGLMVLDASLRFMRIIKKLDIKA